MQAFQPGFRMFISDVNTRTKDEAERFRQLTFTCLQNINTCDLQNLNFPTAACPAVIMTAVRLQTCWDGENLNSPDHMAQIAYPKFHSFKSGGLCPASHPLRKGQLFYEVI
ncbi:hypothetical protein BDU57DRAFT_182539 [Ampelomyces quisqualis]|uniref:DUF1996 domain-containing protein n=1 Tax=Ampelomyces quisqualis TaxID=50730 RepID=A0A6A5QTR0_AMPQU|nr:hypothetical protein BDU57DRAFT_182539 [Ampelomyces quisqualis]